MTYHDRLKSRLSSELRERKVRVLSTFVPSSWTRSDFASSIAWEDGKGLGECPEDGAPGSCGVRFAPVPEDGDQALRIPFARHLNLEPSPPRP